ncbi:MAG: M42 family metallopeptidase [Candidatus Lokiarchaeota archaeon]|nr:M42 family metallopeptidase [Candidatus Harpocratesius repetitus]
MTLPTLPSDIKVDEKFLQLLVNTPSVSGYETSAQHIFKDYLASYVERINTDVMGNVFATLNSSGSPKIMLAAHCDEVGLLIKYISKDGFLYFYANGLDPHLLPGTFVKIITNQAEILGVIGKKAIHLQEPNERKKVVQISDLFIDIGARSRKEVESLGIRIGDSAIFDYYYARLGSSGDVVSRCFDDKIGVCIVAEIMKRLSEIQHDQISAQVIGVSTTQEEVGLRGATTASFQVEPDIALVYDVDFSMDTPHSQEKYQGRAKLGGGPIISIGPNMNSKVIQLLKETANDLDIPIQLIAEPRGTGTDANVIQLTKKGVAIGLIGIPNRYMHSYSEVVNLYDVEAIIQLSVEFIKRVKE